MRGMRTVGVCLGLLTAASVTLAAIGTIKDVALADGRDEVTPVSAPVVDGASTAVTIGTITGTFDRGAKIVARDTGQFGDEERELCGEIFSEIVADDVLASDIITRVRALVRREELPHQPVDLNEICRSSARLLQYDAVTRGAEITLALLALLAR